MKSNSPIKQLPTLNNYTSMNCSRVSPPRLNKTNHSATQKYLSHVKVLHSEKNSAQLSPRVNLKRSRLKTFLGNSMSSSLKRSRRDESFNISASVHRAHSP